MQDRTAKELIEILNQLGESTTIEAKRGTDVGRSLHETISAFSNEPDLGGGYIVLGVEKDESTLFPTYSVTGVDDIEKLKRDIATQCAGGVFNMPIRPKLIEEQVDGKNVLVVAISEAQHQEKPVYIKSVGLPKGAYRRIGESDIRCTDEDLQLLFANQNQKPFDGQIVEGSSLDDLDPEAIELYRNLRSRVNKGAEELSWGDEDLLRCLNCAVMDKKTGQLVPTVAGIVVFGKPQALRRLFPMTRVDYIRVKGTEWVDDPEERFSTVEIRDCLIRAVQRAEAAILDDLPKAFYLPEGEMQRKDRPSIPAKVVREAVVNALIHRSYREQRPVQFRRFANRLELYNPGYSLASEDRLGEPGSYPRNPSISAIFHDLNLAETKGSGIRTMISMMEAASLTPPSFETDREANSFTAVFLFHHFLSPLDVAWLSQFKSFGLSEAQNKALIYVRETGGINNSGFRTMTKMETLEASKQLQQMCKLGLLEKRDKGSATYYVKGQVFEKTDILSAMGLIPSGSNRVQLGPNGTQLDPNGGQLPPNSDQLKGTMSPQLLKAISGVGPRARKDKTMRAVLALCEWQPLSAEQLAGILGRKNKKKLLSEILQPLLAQGKLVYTIPNVPNHPMQKYTVQNGN